VFFLVFSAVTAGLAGLVVFIYYFRRGHFDDVEDIKYEMFRDEHRESRPIDQDGNKAATHSSRGVGDA
jgi:nitrogen fixation-related uncharacterized protein